MEKEKLKQTKAAEQNKKNAGQQDRTKEQGAGTGTDEIINTLVDYLLKEIAELKKENKKLKENYENTKEEYNKIVFQVYGIYPGIDEE